MRYSRLVLVASLLAVLLDGRITHAAEPAWKWYEVKDGQVHLHLHVFWSETCPHCIKAHAYLAEMQKRHEWLTIHSYEVSRDATNMNFYRTMAESIGKRAGQVPAFFYCKRLEIGFDGDATGKRIEQSVIQCREALQKQLDSRRPPKPTMMYLPLILLISPLMEETPAVEPDIELDLDLALPPETPSSTVDLPWWGTVQADQVSLPALTIVLGGLDSFNPCAFFVLLILLGILLHTGSRRKMLLVGGVFVFISGFVYFLFMAAWLNLFFLVGHLRIITLAAGAIAIVAAVINIKDYFWFKQGVSLSLTDSARSRLVQRMMKLVGRSGVVPVIAGTAVLAFAANLYELLCTSGFPLVYTRVLTLRQLSPAEYYGYLALYNVVYVIPLFLIVVVFSLTLSAHKLTVYQGRVLKLISGLMMLALGVILVVSPAFLNNLIGAGVTLVASIGGAFAIVLIRRAVLRHRSARLGFCPNPSRDSG